MRPDQIYPVEADTFLLLEVSLGEVRCGDRVLEVGTGSGHIARALMETASFVLATDINPHAVRYARFRGVNVVRTDLVAGICGTFDLIVFNPPYLPTRAEERIDDWLERALDGGPGGREVIDRFLKDVGRVLSAEGRILLLVSSLTGLSGVRETMRDAGLSGSVVGELLLEDETLYVIRGTRID